MPADTFLGIQKVANGWVALPDGGGSDLTAVVQVFTTPDDLAGFVMGWALTSMGARPHPDAPPPGRRCDGSEGHWPSPPEARPQPDAPPAQAILTPGVIGPPTGPSEVASQPPPPPPPQFVTDQPAVASQPPSPQQ